MADEERGPLSDWLELMLAEITRRQEEAQAGDIEQAARASQPSQHSTSDVAQMTPSSQSPSPSRPSAAPRAKPAASPARPAHRARSV